ncbi:tripartite motif-containing protein 41 [Pelomyxa schiedti]|nr:tripartite motif-containing protein 41 [Pelomyxa schiedti]
MAGVTTATTTTTSHPTEQQQEEPTDLSEWIDKITNTEPHASSSSSSSATCLCSMCQAMGKTDVKGVYWCVECTKASGGGAPLMFCESCWSKAHWAPWLMSHAKAEASSIPQEPLKTRICEKHRLQLDLFCETDRAFICPTCSFSSSHKSHNIVTVEDLCEQKKINVEAFLLKISKFHTDLNSCAKSIESVRTATQQVHSQFEEKVCSEFGDMIARLQRRQEELLSVSLSIASAKACTLSRQLENVSIRVKNVERCKSKFQSILSTGDPFKIIECCDSIDAILKKIECDPEQLAPCATATLSCCTDDIVLFKSKIPNLCFISSGPVLECIKLESDAKVTGGYSVTLRGQWPETATNQDIRVGVGESECTNVNIVTPGSVLNCTVPDYGVGRDLPVSLSVFGVLAETIQHNIRFSFPGLEIQNVTRVPRQGGKVTITGRGFGTSPREITVCVDGVMCRNVEVTHPHTVITCTVPPPQARDNQAKLVLTVAGQNASCVLERDTTTPSTTWEWDTMSCGNLLVIPPDDKSTVLKPKSQPSQHEQSAVAATTQLIDTNLAYEWHLSISGLVESNNDHWVAYGLTQKPLVHDSFMYANMHSWSTANQCYRLPPGTPAFQATGGREEVTFRDCILLSRYTTTTLSR